VPELVREGEGEGAHQAASLFIERSTSSAQGSDAVMLGERSRSELGDLSDFTLNTIREEEPMLDVSPMPHRESRHPTVGEQGQAVDDWEPAIPDDVLTPSKLEERFRQVKSEPFSLDVVLGTLGSRHAVAIAFASFLTLEAEGIISSSQKHFNGPIRVSLV